MFVCFHGNLSLTSQPSEDVLHVLMTVLYLYFISLKLNLSVCVLFLQMLKRVLGESGESSEVREEDKQSHHSDSVMECRKTPRQHTGTNTRQ